MTEFAYLVRKTRTKKVRGKIVKEDYLDFVIKETL